LGCRAGEECKRECSLWRCTPAALEVERRVPGGGCCAYGVQSFVLHMEADHPVVYWSNDEWQDLFAGN